MNQQVAILAERQVQAKQMLESNFLAIMRAVNNDKAKASSFQAAIIGMLTDPNLAECSVESIVKNGLNIIQLGLNPQKTFGQAYIVPFGYKKDENGLKQAQLQIGYKGFITIAYRNGWVFRAVPVYKCDTFKQEFGGLSDNIIYEPNYEKQDNENPNWVLANLKGIIVYAKDGQGNIFTEFVPFAKLEKLRLKSQNQKDPKQLTYIWAEWAEEMYKAKALKYVATRLPITENMQYAINLDNEMEVRDTQEYIEVRVENALINEVTHLAQEKNVALERVLEAYGKTDISQMNNEELLSAKKRLEATPKKEVVA
ncbi:recombinase RecT [Campylobacter sp. JMF_01 NE2]|uniref:recombinase RecT n=1 Tax=unclassified Campylobacter TaxID=2593542 RepID=UPI0022E9F482|nr:MULTISPECIES: recombinase RecT [unclassified Campylobacter]MDA3053224.1 recombinase RecT [Campylobacter sp. JMF_03 NE3]MDA3067593.1 recombinase RecT [Campylobacter sp. JMF_01 NE2]